MKRKSPKKILQESISQIVYPILEENDFQEHSDKEWFTRKTVWVREVGSRSDFLYFNYDQNGWAKFFIGLASGDSEVMHNYKWKYKNSAELRLVLEKTRDAYCYELCLPIPIFGSIWFRPKRVLHGSNAYCRVGEKVLSIFDECLQYFSDNKCGAHIMRAAMPRIEWSGLDERLSHINPLKKVTDR